MRAHSLKGCGILAACLSALPSCQLGSERCGPSTGVVARVLDGDTIELETGERVRYLLIDTPEVSGGVECFGLEAKDLNTDLVLGKTVSLRYEAECTDKFDRLLAFVSLDGREINTLLLERGYACVLFIPPNGSERLDEFNQLESAAKAQDKGLWGNCETNPC